MILALLDEAVTKGARFERACETIGLSCRTVQRWREDPHGEDERTGPKSKPVHALTPEERKMIVEIATSPRFRNLSPKQIVPTLADEGCYVASESSFYRVLHEQELMAHRGHARPASHSKPKTHVATGPCQPDGTIHSLNMVDVRWSALPGHQYSLDVVTRSGEVIGPCIASVNCPPPRPPSWRRKR